MSTMEDKPDYAVEARMPRKVTISFDLSQEALDRVLDKNPRVPSAMLGQLQSLTAGFMTLCEELRDEQAKPLETETGGQPHVPNLRRQDDLREAGRAAAIAISNAQTALMYARRAAELVHVG